MLMSNKNARRKWFNMTQTKPQGRQPPACGSVGSFFAGWSLCLLCAKAHSRVCMAKGRTASRLSYVQRRNSGRAITEKDRRRATFGYDPLPKTPRQVVKHWKKYGILSLETEGGRLELRNTRKDGDKASGGLALCATSGADKNRHYVYETIRP